MSGNGCLPESFEKSRSLSITFECSEALAKAIEDEAKARLTSVSSILRMALEGMLKPRLLENNKSDFNAIKSPGVLAGAPKKPLGNCGRDCVNVAQQRC